MNHNSDTKRGARTGLPFLALWRNAVRDSGQRSSAKLVALVLSTYMKSNGCGFPGKETLADGASLGKRTVDRAVSELEGNGFVRVERTHGRRSNRYIALIPNGAADAGSKDPQPCSGEELTMQPTTANRVVATPESVGKRNKESGNTGFGEGELGQAQLPSASTRTRSRCPVCAIEKRDEDELRYHVRDVHGDEALRRYYPNGAGMPT
jgi:hypothetical protein